MRTFWSSHHRLLPVSTGDTFTSSSRDIGAPGLWCLHLPDAGSRRRPLVHPPSLADGDPHAAGPSTVLLSGWRRGSVFSVLFVIDACLLSVPVPQGTRFFLKKSWLVGDAEVKEGRPPSQPEPPVPNHQRWFCFVVGDWTAGPHERTLRVLGLCSAGRWCPRGLEKGSL